MFSEQLPKWTLSKDEVFLLGLSNAPACMPSIINAILESTRAFLWGSLNVLGKNISSVINTDILDKEVVLILHC